MSLQLVLILLQFCCVVFYEVDKRENSGKLLTLSFMFHLINRENNVLMTLLCQLVNGENRFTRAVFYALLHVDFWKHLQIISSQEIKDLHMDKDANENISKIVARGD